MRSYQEYIERKKAQYNGKFDASDLNPEFIPHFESKERITVQFSYGERRRGTIGITTGWKPIFLLMARKDSTGSSDTIGKDDKVIPDKKIEKKVYMVYTDNKAYTTYNKK